MTSPGDEEISIRIKLANELSGPAQIVVESLKDIQRETNETTKDYEELDIAARRLAQAQAELALANELAARSMHGSAEDQVAANGKVLRAQQNLRNEFNKTRSLEDKIANERRKADQEWTRQHLKTYDNFLKGVAAADKLVASTDKYLKKIFSVNTVMKVFTGSLKLMGMFFLQFLKWGALAVGMLTLLAVAGAAASVAMTALGGAVLTGAQALGVFKMAAGGVAQTIKDLSAYQVNMQAIAQDMMKISPNAAQAAMYLAQINRTLFRDMQNNVQDSFFAQVNQSLGDLPTLIQNVSGPLTDTANILGYIIRQLLDLSTSPIFSTDLQTILRGGNIQLTNLGQGFIHLVSALAHFFALAQPFFIWLSAGFKQGATNFDNWIHSAKGARSVIDYFMAAETAVHNTWQTMRYLTLATVNFLRGMSQFGTQSGGGLVNWAKNLAAVTGSSVNQQKFRQFWTGMMQVFKVLFKLISDFWKMTQKLLNNQGVQKIIVFILNFFHQLAQSGLINAIGNLGQAVGRVLQVLQQSGGVSFFQLLAQVLNDIAGAVNFLSGVLAALPAPVVKVLSYLVVGYLFLVKLDWIFGLIAKLIWVVIIPAIEALGSALLFLADNPIVLLFAAAVALGVGLGLLIGWIIKHWDKVKKWFDDFMKWLRGPWGTAFLLFLDIFAPFIGIPLTIMAHWGQIKKFFQDLASDVKGAFQAMSDGIKWVWDHSMGPIVNFIASVLQGILDAWYVVKNIGKSTLEGQGSVAVGGATNPKDPNYDPTKHLPQQTIPGATNSAGNKVITGPGNSTKPPHRWAGGHVDAYTPYLVGELGPEFYKSMGKLMMVGAGGPEIRYFNEPGTIIPNHRLSSEVDTHALMSSDAHSIYKNSVTNSNTRVTIQGDTVSFRIEGNQSMSPQALERAVRRAMEKVAREKQERMIHHAANPNPAWS